MFSVSAIAVRRRGRKDTAEALRAQRNGEKHERAGGAALSVEIRCY
jgi:hypothetical protein